MARTQKDIVSYFPHDAYASAKSDTVTVMQSKYGNDGYAFWFKLLEKLATTDGHYIDLRNPARLQVFMAKMGVEKLLGVEMLNLLVEMEAIDKELWESKVIWCQNLVDNVADVYKNRRREIPSKPIITGSNQITTESKAKTTSRLSVEKQQIKLNKTKGNNIDKETASLEFKETDFNEFTEELKAEFSDINFDNEFKKFKLYWSEGGRKLKRPKLALRNWMEKARQILAEKEARGHKRQPADSRLERYGGNRSSLMNLIARKTKPGIGKLREEFQNELKRLNGMSIEELLAEAKKVKV